MDQNINEQITGLKRLYRNTMSGLLGLTLVTFVLYFLFPGLSKLSREAALVSKSVLIILFLSIVPLMLSFMRRRLERIPSEATLFDKLAVYKNQFQLKSGILAALCILSMVVFVISGDPMILILLIAGILFLYFERPNHLKIRKDFRMDERE